MKTVICYYSCHHGNTRKVAQAMAEECGATLLDLSAGTEAQLEEYDLIGFASGIYGFSFHPSVVQFARVRLPRGKRIFCIYTYGGAKGMGAKEIARIAKEKGCGMMGEFGCRGYNTFGPFKARRRRSTAGQSVYPRHCEPFPAGRSHKMTQAKTAAIPSAQASGTRSGLLFWLHFAGC